MASRVPYESAARTLTQSKRSYAGYAVRHGLAINLEHNFMMTPKGRENFQNQLNQLIDLCRCTEFHHLRPARWPARRGHYTNRDILQTHEMTHRLALSNPLDPQSK